MKGVVSSGCGERKEIMSHMRNTCAQNLVFLFICNMCAQNSVFLFTCNMCAEFGVSLYMQYVHT